MKEKHIIRKATTKEIIQINRLLAKVVSKNTDGTVHYKEGSSDYLVAEEMGDGLTHLSVARIRKELYGNLRVGANGRDKSSGAGYKAIVKRIEAIEEALRKLGCKV